MSDKIYLDSLLLLQQIKLVQGNTALNSTLRRHKILRDYLIEKQRDFISSIESSLQD